MKHLVAAIALLALYGCARVGIQSDDMQSDGTYRIKILGNAIADRGDVERLAKARAMNLCPFGFKTHAMFSTGQEAQLIVKCITGSEPTMLPLPPDSAQESSQKKRTD